MKKIFIALMAIAGIATCANAQTTYNMNVHLNDGTVVTYAADDVAEVTFQEVEVFNILTEEHIPDLALRTYIQSEIANGAEVYTNLQAAAYEGSINLNGVRVYNTQGLEFFTGLQVLDCHGLNRIKSIDISALKNLREFYCNNCNYLETLTVGQNDKLELLDMSDCPQLQGYDLTQLPSTIKTLRISSLGYESIPFDHFPQLETLNANMNQLTELDIHDNRTIKTIYMSSNLLSSVNVSGCENLEFILVSFNSNLSSIDINGCSNLKALYIQRTLINEIDLTPVANTLQELNVSHNGFNSLDVSQCHELNYLECQDNNLSGEIDLSANTKLEILRIEENDLQTVNLSGCNELVELSCYSMETLTSLILPEDQSHITLLNTFTLPNLASLNTGNLSSINYMNVYSTALTRLDISGCNPLASSFYLAYNENLRQIKVWPDFDMDNPPSSIYKDETATFVYEFTED